MSDKIPVDIDIVDIDKNKLSFFRPSKTENRNPVNLINGNLACCRVKTALLELLVVNIAGKSWARRVQFLKFTA